MNVDLSSEASAFVERLVASGWFQPADEVVAGGVRSLMSQQLLRVEISRALTCWMPAKVSTVESSLPNQEDEQKSCWSQLSNAQIGDCAVRSTGFKRRLPYIARDKPVAATQWVEKIEEKCRLITTTPEFGELRPEYGAEIRDSEVGRYVIFFRPIENGIEVVRVIAGDRDIRSLQGTHRRTEDRSVAQLDRLSIIPTSSRERLGVISQSGYEPARGELSPGTVTSEWHLNGLAQKADKGTR